MTEDSAAASAGLQPGDVIVKYEGHPVRDFPSLVRLISQNNPGDTVTVQILRDSDTLLKQVTFGEWE